MLGKQPGMRLVHPASRERGMKRKDKRKGKGEKSTAVLGAVGTGGPTPRLYPLASEDMEPKGQRRD